MLLLSCSLASISPAWAKDKKGTDSWAILEREGKTLAVVHEKAVRDPKEKSFTLTQTWTNRGKVPGSIEVEAVALDDATLEPSWLHVRYRSADGSESYTYRLALRMNGRFKDLEVTFERLKPKSEKAVKTVPKPSDAIFFSMLPRYVARLKPGFYVATGIMEDTREARLVTRPLRIQKIDEKKKIGGNECEKALVDAGGDSGYLWVTSEGVLCDFEMQGVVHWKFAKESEAKAAKDSASSGIKKK